MPKQQQGTVVKRGPRNYGARYHDEGDPPRRRYQGGFTTQSAAEAWLRTRVAEVAALRRGDTPRPDTLPTVAELIDSFLATHEVDPELPPHVRGLVDPGGHAAVLPGAVHGHVGGADRQDVRASGTGLRRVPARPARRLRRRAYWHCCGTVGAQSGMATPQ
jgi:hypothetical protein